MLHLKAPEQILDTARRQVQVLLLHRQLLANAVLAPEGFFLAERRSRRGTKVMQRGPGLVLTCIARRITRGELVLPLLPGSLQMLRDSQRPIGERGVGEDPSLLGTPDTRSTSHLL